MASKRTRVRKRPEPELVLRGGKPAAVILDIGHYRELVERAEDPEDLRALEAMRSKPIRFRKLDDFLKSYIPDA